MNELHNVAMKTTETGEIMLMLNYHETFGSEVSTTVTVTEEGFEFEITPDFKAYIEQMANEDFPIVIQACASLLESRLQNIGKVDIIKIEDEPESAPLMC